MKSRNVVLKIGGSYLRVTGESFAFGFVRDLPSDFVKDEADVLDGPVHHPHLVGHGSTLHDGFLDGPNEIVFKF